MRCRARTSVGIPSRRDNSLATSADWLNPRHQSGSGGAEPERLAAPHPFESAAACSAPSFSPPRPCGRISTESPGFATAHHRRRRPASVQCAAASPNTRRTCRLRSQPEGFRRSGNPHHQETRPASSNPGRNCARRQRWRRTRRSAAAAQNRAPSVRRSELHP